MSDLDPRLLKSIGSTLSTATGRRCACALTTAGEWWLCEYHEGYRAGIEAKAMTVAPRGLVGAIAELLRPALQSREQGEKGVVRWAEEVAQVAASYYAEQLTPLRGMVEAADKAKSTENPARSFIAFLAEGKEWTEFITASFAAVEAISELLASIEGNSNA